MKKSARRTQVLMVMGAIAFYTAMQHLGEVRNALWWLVGVTEPIIVGLCIAFVLNIPMSLAEDKLFRTKQPLLLKLKRPLSMLIAFAMAIGLLVLLVGVALPQISDTVNLLISRFPEYVKSISDWAGNLLEHVELTEALEAEVGKMLDSLWNELLAFLKSSSAVLAGSAINFTASVLNGIIDAILSIAIALYVLAQKEDIGRICARAIKAYLPVEQGARIFRISRLTYRAFANFIKGQLTEAAVLGLLCFAGMAIFRFPSPGVISLMIGVMAIVPVIGPWTGGILSTFLVLILAPQKVLWYLLFIVVLTQIEDNVIYPRVVGNTMGLPGLLVLTAVVIGVNVYGIVGLLVSVPLCAVLYGLLKEGIEIRMNRKKHPDTAKTETYASIDQETPEGPENEKV